MNAKRIERVSQVCVPYATFPLSKYVDGTPLRVFQALYPENHYSTEIDVFLKYHDYKPSQRGADLPWWGSKFFADEPGSRVLVVAQDSYAEDAGSVVFYSALFPLVHSEESYQRFIAGPRIPKFPYVSWRGVRDQLAAWHLKLDYCYITDAAKVYRAGSWKYGDFDRDRSAMLLQREIEACSPQLAILLGGAALRLLRRDLKYSETVESGEPIYIIPQEEP
jgi:hypothetical protein